MCETLECLHAVPLFATLTARELKRLESLFHERRYGAGEVIFEQGDEGLGVYVIIQGKVRIQLDSRAKENELARLGPGQYFGELALLDGAPRSATAIAEEPSRLIGFFRPEFLEILESHGAVGTKISLQLARQTGQRLREILSGKSIESAA